MSEPQKPTRREYLKYVAGAAVVAAVAGVGYGAYEATKPAAPPPEAVTQTATVTATPSTVTATVSAAPTISIVTWDQFALSGTSALGPAAAKISTALAQKYPNIKIVRTFNGTFDIRSLTGIAYPAGTGPELNYTWPSCAVLNQFAAAGYLLDLTDVGKKLGWFDRVPAWALARCTYQGRLYGYPHEWDFYGLYYNRTKFNELGLAEPKTWDELTALCDKIKSKGYVPIVAGGPFSNPHVFGWVLATLGWDRVQQVLFGDGKYTDADVVGSFQKIAALSKYFQPNYDSYTWDEQASDFINGKALMLLNGTWQLGAVTPAEKKFDVGIFYPPSVVPGAPPRTFVGEGSEWQVTTQKSDANTDPDKQQAAIEYMDFLMDPQWEGDWLQYGSATLILNSCPIVDPSQWSKYPNVDPLLKEAYVKGNGVLHDCSVSDMWVTCPSDISDLTIKLVTPVFLGTMSAAAAMAQIQAAWDKDKAGGLLWQPGVKWTF